MKIQVELQNVYRFKELGEFDSYQVEYEYRLIDNDINIRLGVLAFQNMQYNINYVPQKDLWSLYDDASEGFVETIYDRMETDDVNEIEKYVDIHIDDILDEINEDTKKLQAYINNDKTKLKKLLTILCRKFIKNKPSYNFAKKNTMKTIF